MILRILNLNLLLLVLAAQKVCAQLAPADDFFNGGAQLYISNNIPAALERTQAGLKLYPDDGKLKKLEELLKQKQQSQSQQNQQSKSQPQNSQSQKNQSQPDQKQNSSGQKNQPNQQNAQNQQQPPPENQKNQPDKNEPPKSGDDKSKEQPKQNDGNQPGAPNQMTPAEAKELLDAQKGNEQLLQLKPPVKPENSATKIKDW